MRLKYYYWVLVGIWHLLLLAAGYHLFRETYYWFILLQFVLLGSLIFAYRIYRHFQRPLELVNSGKGALRDRDFSVKFRQTGIPEVDSLVVVFNKMIDTLRQERTLLEEQHLFLRKIIEASPIGILIMDHDGAISELNPMAKSILGFDPLADRRKRPTTHPILAASRLLKAGNSEQVVIDGTDHFRLEASAFIDRGFERKFVQIQTLTEEILEAEKRAYGQVIRMMAHEVNNSIGAINALLDTLNVAPKEADKTWIEDVLQSLPIAIKRNQRLNTFMRNFADVVRLPNPKKEWLDLVPLLQQATSLFQAKASQQNTQISLSISGSSLLEGGGKQPSESANSCYIQADPFQLEQVLVNVIKNALESLKNGGQIKVELAKNPIRIAIADNGPGLDEEAVAGIFTPFFTSKPNGQGIGLTLVREILIQHGFRFSLSTDKDGWTRFVIQF